MNSQILKNYTDVCQYIRTHKISNIDIRFLDNDSNIKGFTLSANSLYKDIFINNYFIFNKLHLLPITGERNFKDPFLTQPTLVFFTNLVSHKNKILELKQQIVNSPYLIEFYINTPNLETNNCNYATPPQDHNRNIRDEIISALNVINVPTTISFSTENNGNIIGITDHTKLDLLDNIEKAKYVILQVTNMFNTEVNLKKGIFSKPTLLSL